MTRRPEIKGLREEEEEGKQGNQSQQQSQQQPQQQPREQRELTLKQDAAEDTEAIVGPALLSQSRTTARNKRAARLWTASKMNASVSAWSSLTSRSRCCTFR
jgi:hypothetical protein